MPKDLSLRQALNLTGVCRERNGRAQPTCCQSSAWQDWCWLPSWYSLCIPACGKSQRKSLIRAYGGLKRCLSLLLFEDQTLVSSTCNCL